MATTVTIAGSTYSLPQQGDSPPWGTDLTDLIQALVNVAAVTTGTGDILTTSFSLGNNTSGTVTGLAFDTSVIRSASIAYSIYRTSSTNEFSEQGVILIAYKSTANTWELAQWSVGNAGVTFTISSAGQISFASTDIGSTSYSGKLKFSAKAFTQT